VLLNDVVIKQTWELEYRNYTYKGKIINDLTEELKEIISNNETILDEKYRLGKEIDKLEKEIFDLKSKLNKFNKSRKFWERKFNIND
jgi:flagellar capping protein FliD